MGAKVVDNAIRKRLDRGSALSNVTELAKLLHKMGGRAEQLLRPARYVGVKQSMTTTKK